jgi:hypothetical protein
MLYWVAIASASRGGVLGSIASMILRSDRRMEIELLPTLSRAPEKELPVTIRRANHTLMRNYPANGKPDAIEIRFGKEWKSRLLPSGSFRAQNAWTFIAV